MHILQTVPTIYDLRILSINLSDDATVIVQGYNFPGDGGGGTFIYKKIVPSDANIP